jgi:hypothetical protein
VEVVGIPTWLYFIVKGCSCVLRRTNRADEDVANRSNDHNASPGPVPIAETG